MENVSDWNKLPTFPDFNGWWEGLDNSNNSDNLRWRCKIEFSECSKIQIEDILEYSKSLDDYPFNLIVPKN